MYSIQALKEKQQELEVCNEITNDQLQKLWRAAKRAKILDSAAAERAEGGEAGLHADASSPVPLLAADIPEHVLEEEEEEGDVRLMTEQTPAVVESLESAAGQQVITIPHSTATAQRPPAKKRGGSLVAKQPSLLHLLEAAAADGEPGRNSATN